MIDFDYEALRSIGLNNTIISRLAEAGAETPGGRLCRITEYQRDRITLHDGSTETHARALPRLLAETALCVGDWVIADTNPLNEVWISRRLSPMNQFSRADAPPIASNIDTALLVMGLDGDFNPRRIERYLALAAAAEVTPLIVLSKPDLCTDLDGHVTALTERLPSGTQFLLVNGTRPESVAQLEPWLGAGQTICLLGSSGAGKSTLIKTIAGDIDPLTGTATTGKGLVIGYFAQHQVEMLRHDESPLWHLQKMAPTVREQELRNFLGSFNFPGDMVTSKIAPFSGGEKARLALALIVWQRPNLLLLDEPTNHLDLETREALTDALAQFEGTLLVVSHDRHLLRATTEQFIIVENGRLREFDGDLDEYKDWLLQTKLAKPAAASSAAPAAAGQPAAAEASPLDRKEQKRLEAEQRQRLSAQRKPLENRLKKVEAAMAQRSEQKAAIDAALADPAIYEAENKPKLKTLLADQVECSKELEQLEGEWLELQEQLEALAA